MKLGLGTVQFGLDYGISNRFGRVSRDEVRAMLEFAAEREISLLDTAADYGDSERVMGECLWPGHGFAIVTKTPAFGGKGILAGQADGLERRFLSSLESLHQASLYGLVMHHAEDILADGGERLLERMESLKDRGLVEKTGVSVYSGEQIDRILDRHAIDLVQVPLNLLDQRLIAGGHLEKLKDAGVEIHARSIFLQGLLLMPPDEPPPFFDPIRPLLKDYRLVLAELGMTPVEAALGFVRTLSAVDCAVIGVCSAAELVEVSDAFTADRGTVPDPGRFAVTDERMVDPSRWPAVR